MLFFGVLVHDAAGSVAKAANTLYPCHPAQIFRQFPLHLAQPAGCAASVAEVLVACPYRFQLRVLLPRRLAAASRRVALHVTFNAALTQVHARMGRPMSMCRLHGDSHPARLGIYRLFPYLHCKNPEPCIHPLFTCRTDYFFFFFDSACESSAAIKEREEILGVRSRLWQEM